MNWVEPELELEPGNSDFWFNAFPLSHAVCVLGAPRCRRSISLPRHARRVLGPSRQYCCRLCSMLCKLPYFWPELEHLVGLSEHIIPVCTVLTQACTEQLEGS